MKTNNNMNIEEQIREKIEAEHFAKGSDYTTDDIVIDVMEIINQHYDDDLLVKR